MYIHCHIIQPSLKEDRIKLYSKTEQFHHWSPPRWRSTSTTLLKIRGKKELSNENASVYEFVSVLCVCEYESGDFWAAWECCWKPQTMRAPLALKAVTDMWEHLLLHCPPPIQRIDIWARVRSPGPLMADEAGARGNTIHADEQPARGEGEGVVRGKGSVESGGRWKQLPLDHWS